MNHKGLFLGLDHDLSAALSGGYVSFWARERLESGCCCQAVRIGQFLRSGVYGRIGCGGLHAIKERQLVRGDQLTPAIGQCFQILEAVISI